MKYAIVCLLLIFPINAAADGFKVITQSRIEYKHTYSKIKKRYLQPDLNFRVEHKLGDFDKFKTAFWIVPRLRFGFGNWKLGPEFRIPTFNNKTWKLLLQAELDI